MKKSAKANLDFVPWFVNTFNTSPTFTNIIQYFFDDVNCGYT